MKGTSSGIGYAVLASKMHNEDRPFCLQYIEDMEFDHINSPNIWTVTIYALKIKPMKYEHQMAYRLRDL